MITAAKKTDYIGQYNTIGEQKFYLLLVSEAMSKVNKMRIKDYKGRSPELELIECSEKFLSLYRKDKEELYLDMQRIFRRAAHSVYRKMLKLKMITKNPKFLNLV